MRNVLNCLLLLALVAAPTASLADCGETVRRGVVGPIPVPDGRIVPAWHVPATLGANALWNALQADDDGAHVALSVHVLTRHEALLTVSCRWQELTCDERAQLVTLIGETWRPYQGTTLWILSADHQPLGTWSATLGWSLLACDSELLRDDTLRPNPDAPRVRVLR